MIQPTPVKLDPDYVQVVLTQNFEDAKAQFLAPLMGIHYAHLVMLTERGIIPRDAAVAIRKALGSISLEDVRCAKYDGSCEDLFFYIERLILQEGGEDVAGRLHTARSRNDIDMTMYRMQLREMILRLVEGISRLRTALLDLADNHKDTIFAAHTHTQPAQPTTVAHYLLAVLEQLERDAVRLRSAYVSTNQNPLGSCAITGTGFRIDRQRTTELLGFDGQTGNTYGSIATVDYVLESVSAAAVMVTGVGRVVQDLLLWCTSEFGYLRLADGFVQSSSIMPQKRNPVALEHARALASRALGQAGATLLAVHNTPFGDIVDTEDDLQPVVSSMFNDASRAVTLTAAAMGTATFDRERMAERARQGWITVSEVADTLTRDHGVPFKRSHAVASRFVNAMTDANRKPDTPASVVLSEVTRSVLGRSIEFDNDALLEVLSPEHFVRVRAAPGEPAPAETGRAIAVSRARLASDDAWLREAAGKLRRAEEGLIAAVAALGR